ncbi:hypothetical protein CEXT_257381 [Caerostris extrusa]|uniref:Uncharacterized protein n=1 Tax=Caerostris extrusa TaxID=172846 RepID=A0AAV4RLT2_CAEEX|nr:hypothetical protein CEXT_257381 [Caerostris extrusa]
MVPQRCDQLMVFPRVVDSSKEMNSSPKEFAKRGLEVISRVWFPDMQELGEACEYLAIQKRLYLSYRGGAPE